MILQKISKIYLDYHVTYKKLPSCQKPIWIKNQIQNLGPTYIKIGQFLSTRSDIIGDNVALANGLKHLRDNVDPIAWNVIENMVDTTKFKEIDRAPLATASIGQVHRAVTLDDRDVILKIRKPSVIENIRNDVGFYTMILSMSNKIHPTPAIKELIDILTNIKQSVLNECDLDNEAKNINKFRDLQLRRLRIPEVLPELCTEDIIVMTHVPSIKLTDAYKTPIKRKKLSLAVMSIFIEQFVQKGVIHGDPHPGNFAMTPDKSHFVLYDFGHIVFLDKKVRDNMKLFVFELMNENIDNIIKIIRRVPELIVINDESQLRKYIKEYIKYIKIVDIAVLKDLAPTEHTDLPFKFSPKVFELIRLFGIIEGICLELDPTFSYSEVFDQNADMFMRDTDFIYLKTGLDIDTLIENIL
jgi:predicted unusual protein kinase regulating ubiquinone biosynthesis (AarF/ABC1/UbiB family)